MSTNIDYTFTHFQGESKLVNRTFWHLNISRSPPEAVIQEKFPGKMRKGYVYNPPRVYLHNLAGPVKLRVPYCFVTK